MGSYRHSNSTPGKAVAYLARLDPETYTALDLTAGKLHVSMNAVINDAIQAYLPTLQSVAEPDDTYKSVIEKLGGK